MPVTRTAKRALVRADRKRVTNLRRQRRLRNAIKGFKDQPTQESLSNAVSLIDKFVKYNLFHANKAARMKSQLSRMLGVSK